MSLSVGIVGLPNVGKSTLFNALLKRQVALAANYPFATIEPNVGVVAVPDERLAVLAKVVGTTVLKPATIEFVDIAGLVKGAHKGEGLGNQFLSHIRETDLICHVVRAFRDEQILREGSTTPVDDLLTIRTELQLADLSTLERQPQPKGVKVAGAQERWQAIEFFREKLGQGIMLNTLKLSEVQQETAKELCLLTVKPELFVYNEDEDQVVSSMEQLPKIAEELGVEPEQVVVMSAKMESDLAALDETDQRAYLFELGLSLAGLERLAKVAYDTLGYQSFLTAGELEVKAWTITKGTTAQQAAGVIHTDFAKKFISARIVSYPIFVELGGWKAAKDIGKVRQEGRDYLMQEGDVVEFMIGS